MNTIALVAQPDPFWPSAGPMTVFCYVLGVFDLSLIGFLVSRLL